MCVDCEFGVDVTSSCDSIVENDTASVTSSERQQSVNIRTNEYGHVFVHTHTYNKLDENNYANRERERERDSHTE